MNLIICIGKSMKPTFGRLALVLIRKKDWYQLGDIVSFLGHDKQRYCHRVYKTDVIYQTFTMKGDNKTESQPYEIGVPLSRIEGKAVWHS